MKYLNLIKHFIVITAMIFILYEMYVNIIQIPREEKLINDAKLMTLFMLTEDFEKDDEDLDDPHANLYGESS